MFRCDNSVDGVIDNWAEVDDEVGVDENKMLDGTRHVADK